MSTRAQQFEILAAGVIYDGATIATPYVKFYAAGTTTAKNAYADSDKAVAITKKALDTQGRAIVYGDGIYKLRFYSGDPDAGGVLKFEIDNYKVSAVTGNARTITSTTTGTEDDGLILVNTTSGNVTYTLPAAAPMIGRTLTVKKIAAANILTYAAASGENIDGAASGTLSDENATIQLISDGTNWYGAQIVGTASTLGGYAPDVNATADTIPVRDGDGKLAGDILGASVKVGVLNVKVIDIGDWNMDSTGAVNVAHGLDISKIRDVRVNIRNDDGSGFIPLDFDSSSTLNGWYSTDATNIACTRQSGGQFDSVNFDSTSYNRGWVTVWYVD